MGEGGTRFSVEQHVQVMAVLALRRPAGAVTLRKVEQPRHGRARQGNGPVQPRQLRPVIGMNFKSN